MMQRMRWIFLIAILLAIRVSLPAVASSSSRCVTGSYVTFHVATVDDLCGQISSSKIVAQRYAQHFGVPAKELCAYFQMNLRPAYLKQSGTYKVYFIDAAGRISARTAHLPAGELVFVTPDGKPLILAKCGNPVTRVLPKVGKPSTILESSGQPELIPPVPSVAPTMNAESVAMEPEVPPVTQVAAIPVAELPIKVAQLLPKAGSKAFLPLLLGVGLSTNHHHNPVTPEPSSLLVLAFGIPALAGMARRRSRK